MTTFNTIAQIEAATTKELVAYWNGHATKSITKFTDRATAVKRCVDLMMERGEWDEEQENDEDPNTVAAAEAASNAEAQAEVDAEVQGENEFDASEKDKNFVWPFAKAGEETPEQTAAKAALETPKETKTVTKKAPASGSNSAGVAASWQNPDVAAARLTRDGVRVTFKGADSDFKSVREAFRAFRLMDSKHIRFRGILKANGTATYTENGKDYLFAIV